MNKSQSSVSLWVANEPFSFGTLPMSPNPRLSLHNIRKIVNYAKNKGSSGYPYLSYSVWKHIACNKLQLNEDFAWMYFVNFDLISSTSSLLKKDREDRIASCSSLQEIERVKSQMSCPTLQFIIFLFIQHLHKINLRASLGSQSEEWPVRCRSPEPNNLKNLEEHSHISFLLTNLNEVLELLTDSYAGSSSAGDVSLPLESVRALNLYVHGSVNASRHSKPIADIAVDPAFQSATGFSKVSQTFSFKLFQTWIRTNLQQNPFAVSNCISHGKRLAWPLAGEDKESRSESHGRIATNAHIVPKSQIAGNKLIIMSQICKQTVARSSATLEGSSLKVHRCRYSYLYLLSPIRSASIEKCRHCTIVLGAVETAVVVANCQHVTVISACRRAVVNQSSGCTLHLLTPNKPLLLASVEDLTLAPFHTFYGKLELHLDRVCLGRRLNMWQHPVLLGGSASWAPMSPKAFYSFNIPFEMEGDTKAIPGGLPTRYQKALLMRQQEIDAWQKMVKQSSLNKEQRKNFQALVESKFQEWLSDTGHRRELDGLVVTTSAKS